MSKAISKPSNILVAVCGLILFVAITYVSGVSFQPNNVEAQTSVSVPVTGHAWSDTIGWIEFQHNKTNKVTIDSAGYFQGYAWSDNIGWLKFDKSLAGPGGGGGAQVVNDKVIGWARFCAGQTTSPTTNPNNTCTGVSRTDGWDGWLKFDHGKTGEVAYNPTTKKFTGFAWGSDVVGWVDMSLVGADLEEEVVVDPCDDTDSSNDPAGGCGEDPTPIEHTLTVIISGTGAGSVEGSLWCSDSAPNKTCTKKFNDKANINLSAVSAGATSKFVGWLSVPNVCSSAGDCEFTLNGDVTITANFNKLCTGDSCGGEVDFSVSPLELTANCAKVNCENTPFFVSPPIMTISNNNGTPISVSISQPAGLDIFGQYQVQGQSSQSGLQFTIPPSGKAYFRWGFNSRKKNNPNVESYQFSITASADGYIDKKIDNTYLNYFDLTQTPQ